MKLKIITFLLLAVAVLTMCQTPSVQRLINGKLCDSCFVKSSTAYSNVLPHTFIGAYFNIERLSSERIQFESSMSKEKSESQWHVITDSMLNLVFLTYRARQDSNPSQWVWMKNYDYKKVQIRIHKNKRELMDWQILGDLPPVEGYQVNRITYDEQNQKEIVGLWASTHQTGELHLDYNDLLMITLRETESKDIIKKFFIKRFLDKPHHFIYYQASVNATHFNESLQSFLNDPLSSEKLSQGDTTKSVSLARNNPCI